jgi:two-component system, cell cycle response regulator DivK
VKAAVAVTITGGEGPAPRGRADAVIRRDDVVGPRILVTDDDAATRKLYREVLELRQFTVEEASTGEECVDLAGRLRPALIVLDLHMPIRDGFSAARDLRAGPATRAIPILAVSGASRAQETERALRAGCNAVLNKPVYPRDLLRVVEALLDASRPDRVHEEAELQREASSDLIRSSFPDLRALWALGPDATDTQIRQLMQGKLVTVCSFCSRVRFPREWRELSREALEFFQSWTTLSHAICPECMAREYPEMK